MSDSIRFLIAGDICSAKSSRLKANQSEEDHKAQESPFLKVAPLFKKSNYVVANLECPLTDHPRPIPKTGPCIWGEPEFTELLKSAGINAVGCANNHIKDAGEHAVLETLQTCNQAGISTFGAGKNLSEAARPHIVEIQGILICFLAMAEHEFCLAGPDSPGVNPLSSRGFVRFCREYRSQYDVLIVLYHGGMEQYPYPTPNQQDLCRFMVEEGASLVVCQHSHCVGCAEKYRDGHIVYGQGNFFFPYDKPRPDSWYEGLIVECVIEVDTKSIDVRYIPFIQSQDSEEIKLMESTESQNIMTSFHERSERVQDIAWVQQHWENECKRTGKSLVYSLLGTGRVRRRVNRLFPILDPLTKRHRQLCSLNLIRCQTHRERIQTYLESLSGNN